MDIRLKIDANVQSATYAELGDIDSCEASARVTTRKAAHKALDTLLDALKMPEDK